MLFQPEWRIPVLHEGTGLDKLKVGRSHFPAITHVDYSARIQTVGDDDDPSTRRLLEAWTERGRAARTLAARR